MKRFGSILGILALVICLLLFFLRWHENNSIEVIDQRSPDTNSPRIHQQGVHALNGIRRSNSPPATTDVSANQAITTEQQQQRLLAAWQAPIDFYGKVVDQNGNPVSGAIIKFSWNPTPDDKDNKSSIATSDIYGLFTLHDARGASLEVKVSKSGYYTSQRDARSFAYALTGHFSPDISNPVIYHLRKKGKGEELIERNFPQGMGQRAKVPHDRTPIDLDLLTGKQVPAGSGQIELEYWRDLSNPKAGIFDWNVQLSVNGGGLFSTGDEFAFEAPASGYQPSFSITMPATNQTWQSDLNAKFYIHLSNGDYGRIDLSFSGYNGVFKLHSTINPSGSQNLEPANE